MFTLYGDASGTGASTDVLTMSGFLTTTDQWIRLDRRWRAILDRNQVSSLHMKHFAHSTGEYALWKGDECRRRKFLGDLISEIAPRARHSFSSSVSMPDFRVVDVKYGMRELISPLALVGCTVIAKVYHWADANTIPRNNIDFVFEDGDLDKGNFMQHCKSTWGFTPSFVAKEKARVLEAADLLSYEVRSAVKRIQSSSENKVFLDDMREPFKRLSRIPHGKHGEYWGIHENPILENI